VCVMSAGVAVSVRLCMCVCVADTKSNACSNNEEPVVLTVALDSSSLVVPSSLPVCVCVCVCWSLCVSVCVYIYVCGCARVHDTISLSCYANQSI